MFCVSGKRRILAALFCAILVAAMMPLVASAAGVVKADAGDSFSLAVLSDGSLWGWGYNSQGQLGDGTLQTHLAPSRLDTGTSWINASAGWRHSLAIKREGSADSTVGSLWAWGYNKDGQLGIGHADDSYTPDHWHWLPTRVGSGTSWSQVAAGQHHSVALDANGGIWAWGDNSAGQLGIGSMDSTSVPVLVSASPGPDLSWKRIWAEGDTTLALSSDGVVWQWGSGVSLPATMPCSAAVLDGLPASDQSWWTVSPTAGGGSNRVASVMNDSGLWAWQTSITPVPIGFGHEFLDVAEAAGPLATYYNDAALLIKVDHTLWIALNAYDQPVPLVGSSKIGLLGRSNDIDWQKISAGQDHFLITKSDGSLWGWGRNVFGQLGDGSEYDRNSWNTQAPARILLPTPIPNVVDMTESDARDGIVSRGFKVGSVTYVPSTETSSTRIISQTPAADKLVMPGNTVDIVVSAGPPVLVPNVVGWPEADAQAALGMAGLGVSVTTQEYSLSVPIGAVISEDPAVGTPVMVASKVALVVSKGPRPVTVPYVVGVSASQARTNLTAAGLSVGYAINEYSALPAGQVTRTNPAAGVQVLEGSAVNIYVSLGSAPTKPSLTQPVAKSLHNSRYYSVVSYLRPRHTSGTYPLRIYRWKRTSAGTWKAYGYVKAKAANYYSYTKCTAKMWLTKGKWRLRAYAPADKGHLAVWSSRAYLTVN